VKDRLVSYKLLTYPENTTSILKRIEIEGDPEAVDITDSGPEFKPARALGGTRVVISQQEQRSPATA